MNDKLQPCWHCGKDVHIKDIIDEKGLLMHEFVCATGSSCLGSGLFTAFFPEKKETAIDAWNRRATLYTPVRREDITDGVYWAVTPDKRTFTVEILCGEAYWGKRQDLSVFLRDFPTLYRIPPLNLEVAG